MLSNGVKGLYLNSGRWGEGNIDFLRQLPWLESLRILDFKIEDVSAINDLVNLKQLQVVTYGNAKIDFGSLPNLEVLNLEWCSGFDSLFELPRLRNLFINRLPSQKAELLCRLTGLERLGILSCGAKRLDSLKNLTELKRIRLALFSRLEDNDFMSSLFKLERLYIQSCSGFGSLEPLRGKDKLQVVILDSVKDVSSLAPLEGLRELERVALTGNTNIIDGRTSILRSLPNLKCGTIANRKHYDLKNNVLPHDPDTITWEQYD